MPPRWRSAQLSSREQDGLDFGGGLRQRLGRGGTVNRRATASTWWAPARHRKQDIVVGQRLGGGGLEDLHGLALRIGERLRAHGGGRLPGRAL